MSSDARWYGARRFVGALARRVAGRRSGGAPARSRRRLDELADAHALLAGLVGLGDIAGLELMREGTVLRLNDGRRFWFDPADRLRHMYTVPQIGSFESKETRFIAEAVRPGWCCVDVGASFGWYATLLGMKVGDTGHVHAFEPISSHAATLRDNLDLNGLAKRVTVRELALGDEEGTVELFIPDIGVSGSMRLHDYRATWETHPARLTTLTAVLEQAGVARVDFIKADIEGAELDMLRGARPILERDRPLLLIEVQAHSTRLFGHEPADVFDYLAGLGYAAYTVADDASLTPLDGGAQLPDHNFVLRAV